MRYFVTIGLVLVLLGLLGGVKAAQIGALIASGKQAERAGPPPEIVGTAVAREDTWERTLTTVGSVASRRGVTVTNEAAGVVTAIHFDSGGKAKAGAVLVELDTKVEGSELAAATARKELAATTFGRTRALASKGAVSKAQLDADRTQLETAEKEVASLRAQIAKKTVRAPFAGRLGIRAVDLGQYLAPGTPITALESDKALVVDFTTPQERLGDLAIGMPVRVALAAEGGASREGAIEAIAPAIDVATRTVKVRASVEQESGHQDDALRPGMFVNVTVVLAGTERVVIVPATAVMHASYGDSVFVVGDKPADAPGMRETPDGQPVKVVRQKLVKTGETRGDYVAIAGGIEPGAEIVTAGAFKLRNGAPVVVNNANKPEPEIAPHPPNR
jgi:membrane fusion protein (multidrug efflux system)